MINCDDITYTSAVITILISLGLGFLSGYWIQRGKNKANLRDLDEREKKLNKYKLEFEKSKSLYESKRNQYDKYLDLIDESGKVLTGKQKEKALSVVLRFGREMAETNDDQNKIMETYHNLTEGLIEYLASITEVRERLNKETNHLKNIASERVCILIDELEKIHDRIFNQSVKNLHLIKDSNTKISQLEQTLSINIAELEEKKSKIHEELRKEIKKDLNEI